jgi:GT2 family glycosyltransferase
MTSPRDRPASDPPIACSVLVPVLNEEQQIAASVAAMCRQRFPGPLEFLLVDGGSTDRTCEIIAELALGDERIRLLENHRRATPSGLNVALSHARGRWVARMDAHSKFPEDYLRRGVERLRCGDTRWVSGPQIPTGHGHVSNAVALALETPLGRGAGRRWISADARSGPERELDSGVFCGIWERATLLEYGGWDERWPRNQDSELAGRFLARGERLICLPAMAAEYTPRDSLGSLWHQYLEYGEYRAKTARRHPQTLRRSHLLPPAVVAATAASALVGPRPARRVARAARAAVAVYVSTIAAAGARAALEGAPPGDAALVPVVLSVMHFGHGLGSWRSALRAGPPVAALAEAAGLSAIAAGLAPAPEPAFAPSLRVVHAKMQ